MGDDPAAVTALARVFADIPHNQRLGVHFEELSARRAVLRLAYSEKLIGNPWTGAVHGGVITTLLDTSCGAAIYLAMPDGATLATLDLRIDYLRPATPDKDIVASAECYKLTRNVAFARGLAHQGDPDEPIAHCVGSFMVGSVGFSPLGSGGGGDA